MRSLRAFLGSRWFKLALSAVLLFVLFHHTDRAELCRILSRSTPGWLLVALVALVCSQAMNAARWWFLARPLGFDESLGRFFVCHFSGVYLNLFGPSTVAGDIGRALFMAGGKKRTLALTSVVADRGLGLVALVWVYAASVFLFAGYPLPRLMHVAAWLAPPLTLVAWLWGPLAAVRLLAPTNRWRVLVERDLAPYRNGYRFIFAAFSIAVVFHFTQIGAQVAIAHALDLPIPWTYFCVIIPAINIAGMLPITVSGIGVREAGFWYFLSLIGIGNESAIALGLLASALALAMGLSGGPVFVFCLGKAGAASGATK